MPSPIRCFSMKGYDNKVFTALQRIAKTQAKKPNSIFIPPRQPDRFETNCFPGQNDFARSKANTSPKK